MIALVLLGSLYMLSLGLIGWMANTSGPIEMRTAYALVGVLGVLEAVFWTVVFVRQ